MSLDELDGSGNPNGTGWTGSVADTSAWITAGETGPKDGSPNNIYFTVPTMWPAFKNFDGNAVAGAADNAYVEVILKSVYTADFDNDGDVDAMDLWQIVSGAQDMDMLDDLAMDFGSVGDLP